MATVITRLPSSSSSSSSSAPLPASRPRDISQDISRALDQAAEAVGAAEANLRGLTDLITYGAAVEPEVEAKGQASSAIGKAGTEIRAVLDLAAAALVAGALEPAGAADVFRRVGEAFAALGAVSQCQSQGVDVGAALGELIDLGVPETQLQLQPRPHGVLVDVVSVAEPEPEGRTCRDLGAGDDDDEDQEDGEGGYDGDEEGGYEDGHVTDGEIHSGAAPVLSRGSLDTDTDTDIDEEAEWNWDGVSIPEWRLCQSRGHGRPGLIRPVGTAVQRPPAPKKQITKMVQNLNWSQGRYLKAFGIERPGKESGTDNPWLAEQGEDDW